MTQPLTISVAATCCACPTQTRTLCHSCGRPICSDHAHAGWLAIAASINGGQLPTWACPDCRPMTAPAGGAT